MCPLKMAEGVISPQSVMTLEQLWDQITPYWDLSRLRTNTIISATDQSKELNETKQKAEGMAIASVTPCIAQFTGMLGAMGGYKGGSMGVMIGGGIIGASIGLVGDVIKFPIVLSVATVYGLKTAHLKLNMNNELEKHHALSLFLMFWQSLIQIAGMLVVLGHETSESIAKKADDKSGKEFYGIAKLTILAISYQSIYADENIVIMPDGCRVNVKQESDDMVRFWGELILDLKEILSPLKKNNPYLRPESAKAHHELFLIAIPCILRGEDMPSEDPETRKMYNRIMTRLNRAFNRAQSNKPELDFDTGEFKKVMGLE